MIGAHFLEFDVDVHEAADHAEESSNCEGRPEVSKPRKLKQDTRVRLLAPELRHTFHAGLRKDFPVPAFYVFTSILLRVLNEVGVHQRSERAEVS